MHQYFKVVNIIRMQAQLDLNHIGVLGFVLHGAIILFNPHHGVLIVWVIGVCSAYGIYDGSKLVIVAVYITEN